MQPLCWYEIGGRQVLPLTDPSVIDAHLLALQAAPMLGGLMRADELYITAFLRRVSTLRVPCADPGWPDPRVGAGSCAIRGCY